MKEKNVMLDNERLAFQVSLSFQTCAEEPRIYTMTSNVQILPALWRLSCVPPIPAGTIPPPGPTNRRTGPRSDKPPRRGSTPAGPSGNTGATRLVESTPKHLGIRGSSNIKARRPELEGRVRLVHGTGCQRGDVHCRRTCRLLKYDVEKTIFGGMWSEGRGRWSTQGPFRAFPTSWFVRFALSQGGR